MSNNHEQRLRGLPLTFDKFAMKQEIILAALANNTGTNPGGRTLWASSVPPTVISKLLSKTIREDILNETI